MLNFSEEMESLLEKIRSLKISKISNVVKARIEEFRDIRSIHINTIFKELCFCIITAKCGTEKFID